MSGSGDKRAPQLLHPEGWPEQSDRPRVLIENPDRADLWAHADLLREAGYDVAMCEGPTKGPEHSSLLHLLNLTDSEHQSRTRCPLVVDGHCSLVDGADVVVSTIQLTDSREILAALSAKGSPALVVEGTSFELVRDADVIAGAVELPQPVLPQDLVAAVKRAHSARAGSTPT